jgi:hypothetical protein
MSRWLDVAVAIFSLGLLFAVLGAGCAGLDWLMHNGYAAHIGWTIAIAVPVLLVVLFWEGLADFGRLIRLVVAAVRSKP